MTSSQLSFDDSYSFGPILFVMKPVHVDEAMVEAKILMHDIDFPNLDAIQRQ